MCTVVVRWEPGQPLLALALRDELVGRDFDDPDAWWAEQPDVVGGRDRLAGGSWCVTDVRTGTTALVLNRPQRREAAPGAPSRGVLPLLVAARGRDWTAYVDTAGMAGFALVLAGPDALVLWVFDGERLVESELSPGTHMVTSGGEEDGKADRFLGGFLAAAAPQAWRDLVSRHAPQDDPAALVVRHEADGRAFATVFGQVIEAAPGSLRLSCSHTPWLPETWSERSWP